jgi:hypothetical protein
MLFTSGNFGRELRERKGPSFGVQVVYGLEAGPQVGYWEKVHKRMRQWDFCDGFIKIRFFFTT